MSTCFVLGWRQLKAEYGKFLIAGITLAFAIAVVIVAFSASTMSREALDRAESSFKALGSVTVQPATATRELNDDDVAALRELPGVTKAIPLFFFGSSVSGNEELSDVHVTGIPAGLSVEALGISPQGQVPVGKDGGVLITQRIAERAGLTMGDSLKMLTPTGPRVSRIVGIIDESNARAYLGNSVFVSFEDAQDYAGKSNPTYSRIDLELKNEQDLDAWIKANKGALPRGLQLQESEAAASSIQPYITALGFALAAAAISLTLLAVWLIGVVFAHASESQHETYNTFRQLGASRRWLTEVLAFQVLIFSLLSGVVGAVLGVLLANLLPQALRIFGVSGDYRVRLDLVVIVLAVLAGVFVGFLSTVRTVLQVSSGRKTDRTSGGFGTHSRARTAIKIACGAGLVVIAVGWMLPSGVSAASFALVLAPMAGLWAWVSLVEGFVAYGERDKGFLQKLAAIHVKTGKAMSTICALLAVLTCLGVSFLSTIASVSSIIIQQISTQFGSDIYMAVKSPQVNSTIRDTVTALQGIRTVSPALVADVSIGRDGDFKQVAARVIDPETYFDTASFSLAPDVDAHEAESMMRDQESCSLLLPSGLSSELAVSTGGEMDVSSGNGDVLHCRVAGVISSSLVTGNQIVLQQRQATALGLVGENEWYISLDSAKDAKEAVKEIRGALADTPGITIRSSEVMRLDAVKQTNGYVAFPGLAIAVLSVLGGLGAVALYALELARRSAIYRDLLVLGASVKQLRFSFIIELAWSASIGVFVGTVSGLLGSIFMMRAMNVILRVELSYELPIIPVLSLVAGLLVFAVLCTIPSLLKIRKLQPEMRQNDHD